MLLLVFQMNGRFRVCQLRFLPLNVCLCRLWVLPMYVRNVYLPPCNVCRFSASYFYVCQLRVLQMYACLHVMYAVVFQMYGRFRICQLRVLPMYVRTVYLPPCCFYVCQRRALQMYVRNVCLPSCNTYCCFPSVCQPRFLQIYALFPLFSKCMVVSVYVSRGFYKYMPCFHCLPHVCPPASNVYLL